MSVQKQKQAQEPETIYFTEKGIDLLKVFPEVAELQLAMAAGWRWSDVAHYRHKQFMIPHKPIHIVYTTEAEKERMLGPQASAIQEASREETNTATIEAHVANILADLQKQPQEHRSLDDIADYIASAIYKTPENLHSAILDGVAYAANALIQESEPAVAPQEDYKNDTEEEDVKEYGYFARLYNRAYNYLSSWIY